MSATRREHDLLGEREVPAAALAGIHTLRARENFPLALRPVAPPLVHAYGAVKLACAMANHELGRWDEPTFEAIRQACRELMAGALDEHVAVDALQGGAGTSTNMSVNEVLANRALVLLGRAPGDHAALDPIDDLNLHQSTNDTFPTALRVAAIAEGRVLEAELLALQEAFQERERAFAGIVKIGRTELQDAVLTTLGREMGAYAEAFGRDRWRVSRCEERLRVVNLGGTAIGTGLGAPRDYIFHVVDRLREVTGYGLARAENLVEATQNADVFVEVSGIYKACATNLLKVAGDLRLLGSGPDAGLGELRLPPRQAGSSIMPGKVNPVIPEAVSQAAMLVMGNDQVIAQACAAGSLELNPFLPLVADRLLDSLGVLARAASILRRHAVVGLAADEARCRRHLDAATAVLTALVETIGYEAAAAVAAAATATGRSPRAIAVERGLVTGAELDALVSAEHVMRLGSRPQGGGEGR
ncbi:MAG TPA: aspartate ammonia-lyase [Polyangia bacterium]|jgi:aspartate ammonia-lyase